MKYGRYEIIEMLGEGSMGKVYLAHDPHIDRQVALKVLHRQHTSSKGIVNRFIKEAKAIGRLSHPHIVNVYDVGQDHETIYIAMEYLKGQPLNVAARSGKLSIPAIVRIGRQMAAALDYAHQKGIVHRDIKPSNLILMENDQVKLTDFGIAHFEDASLTYKTHAGDILGTPAYMSPEQIASQKVDNRSDLYSLGVILYELLVGQRPFTERNIAALFSAIAEHQFTPPRKADASIPSGLSDIIIKAMAKDPEDRFQSGAELASALSAYSSDGGSRRRPVRHARIFTRLSWVLVLAAALAAWQLYVRIIAEQPDMTPVSITSEPSNASVYLNNTFKGKTPVQCQLPQGSYALRLTLAQYYESEAQINVRDSEEIPVHLRLIPKD